MFEVVEKEEEKRRELIDPVWMEWMSILSSLIRNTVVQGEGKRGKEGEGGREGRRKSLQSDEKKRGGIILKEESTGVKGKEAKYV